MDPISAVAIGLTVAGGATTALGERESGRAADAMYQYRAKVAENEAIRQRALGEREAAITGIRQGARRADIKAQYAGKNIDVTRGAPKDVVESQRQMDLIDQETIRHRYASEAYGQETQATLYKSAGAQAKYAGDVSAIGTVLSTAGSVAGKWYQMSQLSPNAQPLGGGVDLGFGLGPTGGSRYFS